MQHKPTRNLLSTAACRTAAQRGPRRAFTLVELLVAIIVVGILAALILPAVGGFLGAARRDKTDATIRVIGQIIKERADAIADLDLTAEAKRFRAQDLVPPNSISQQQAEFIIRKNLYRQALPQRIDDLWGLDQALVTAGDNVPQLADWNNRPTAVPMASVSGSEFHSSEVLLWALTNISSVRMNANGKSFPVPTLDLDNLDQSAIGDGNNNGNNEILDGWNQPLHFYTWASRLVRPDGLDATAMPPALQPITIQQNQATRLLGGDFPDLISPPMAASGSALSHPYNQDPQEQTGRIARNINTLNQTGTYLFQYNVPGYGSNPVNAVRFNEANYHTPNTLHFPLLLSVGADGISGLNLPVEVGPERHAQPIDADTSAAGVQVNLDDMTDNITNRQQ